MQTQKNLIISTTAGVSRLDLIFLPHKFFRLYKETDLKMAYEQYNVPLAGDILDDLATAFREIIAKVGFKSLQICIICRG